MFNTKFYFGILIIIMLFVPVHTSQAQVNNENIQTYDIIYLKNEKVLRGEILIFEEEDGDITFVDNLGRKYSFSRFEYDYFIEDKMVRKTESDTIIIHDRKTDEWEINLGFSAAYTFINQDLHKTEYFRNTVENFNLIPMYLRVGAGKYLNRQNFIGFSSEFAFAGDAISYFNGGLRYVHQYDAYKRNVSFYIPVGLDFTSMIYESNFTINDWFFFDGAWRDHFDFDFDIVTSIKAMTLSLGQGFSFILENKKSISAELSFYKSFILSKQYLNTNAYDPSIRYNIGGVKFSLLYNL